MKKETKAEEIARLKEDFIRYLTAVPIYKFASMSIGRSEDCTRIWRDEDPAFSARCESAKADVAKNLTRKAKAEFLLERYFKDEFKPPANELTGDLNFTITRGNREEVTK